MRLEMLGRNFHRVHIPIQEPLVVYFSYETPIAFEHGGKLFISKNEWSQTTGKHLNAIHPDHGIRLPHDIIMGELNNILSTTF